MKDHTSIAPRQRGFTLTEVLIALAIFALGSVAVASIFPSAILIQKRTIDDVNAQAFEATTRSQLLARGFLQEDLVPAPDGVVFAEPDALDNSSGTPQLRWPLRSRSFGSLSEAAVDRELFWVPLFLDKNQSSIPSSNLLERDWSVFIFLVRPSADTLYPKASPLPAPIQEYATPDDAPLVPGVARLGANFVSFDAVTNRSRLTLTNVPGAGLPRLIRTGDRILDQSGNILQVFEANDNDLFVLGRISGRVTGNVNLWFAHPGDGNSSTYAGLFELADALGPTNNLVHPD